MRIIDTFLIVAVMVMLAMPASAQSLYEPWYTPDDSYESFNRALQDSRGRDSVADTLNRQQREWNEQRARDRQRYEIQRLEDENRRLRALRAQERDRQRRYDPASGIWSPARRR